MLLVLAAAKQVGLRCSQGFARSTGGVRQPGRLVSGGYPGRDWFVPEHHLYCSGPEGLGKLMMLSAEEKGKTFEKVGIHLK